jgi:hypothetical protein
VSLETLVLIMLAFTAGVVAETFLSILVDRYDERREMIGTDPEQWREQ